MSLYHFTDRRNLASIKRYGLLSWPELERRGFHYYPGSNSLSRQLDEKHDVANYVHLCLRKYHPMLDQCLREGRIEQFAWLIIDDTVMNWRATLFSDDNAASNHAEIGHDRWIALNSDSNQAEVLVDRSLAAKWIRFS